MTNKLGFYFILLTKIKVNIKLGCDALEQAEFPGLTLYQCMSSVWGGPTQEPIISKLYDPIESMTLSTESLTP